MDRPRYENAPRLPKVIAFVIAIALLYFGREVLMPLAVAVLLSFLLTPAVRFLERWKLSRLPAVLIVFLLFMAFLGGLGYMVGNQLFDVLNELPKYTTNLRTKIESIRGSHGGLAKATASVQELSKELESKPPDAQPPVPGESTRARKAAQPDSSKPLPVQVAEPPPSELQSIRIIVTPLLAPIAALVIVFVFTIVILVKREDLRNRALRLLGRGRIPRATQALDDAAERVTRYLRMQFLVNTVFGTVIALGVYLLGLPSPLLWGALAGMLRFLPYVGAIVGGAIPTLVGFAVLPGWLHPLMVFGLFVIVEMTTGYAVEPWLYGAHTGVSGLAILVSATFWTALWGPVGLLLSTPITVCLMVLGRHVPQLEFLYVLLGDEPVLTPEAELYQRMLALDQQEAQAAVDRIAGDQTPLDIYDSVLLPALRLAEEDRHRGGLDQDREDFIVQSMNEFIAKIAAEYEGDAAAGEARHRVLCLPAGDRADEITAVMLAHALQQAGTPAVVLPLDGIDTFAVEEDDVICICALAPFALMNARTLSKRLRARFPKQHILVGLWARADEVEDFEARLAKAFDVQVATTLTDAMTHLTGVPPREPVGTAGT